MTVVRTFFCWVFLLLFFKNTCPEMKLKSLLKLYSSIKCPGGIIHWNHRRVDEMNKHKPIHEVTEGCWQGHFDAVSHVSPFQRFKPWPSLAVPLPPATHALQMAQTVHIHETWEFELQEGLQLEMIQDDPNCHMSWMVLSSKARVQFLPYRNVFQHRELRGSFFFFS